MAKPYPICKQCHQRPCRIGRQFCSRQCHRMYSATHAICYTKKCEYCGSTGLNYQGRRFCSRECVETYERLHVNDRFWRFVAKTEPNSCWPWLKGTLNGYGRFNFNDTRMLAHRYAWTITHGPIPDGLDVLHACDNPPCCNPAHLFLGTHQDNMADMMQKGRHRTGHGERNANTKFTDDVIRLIRAESARGISRRQLARQLKVHHSTINRIVSRQVWKHVS
jgi:HNH endonuclease